MRKIFAFALIPLFLCATTASAYNLGNYSEAYSTEDYREALNMALKFYGGQRCGETNNWMLKKNKDVAKKYCHRRDGQGSMNGGGNADYDLTGGWHDCGDHIKVAVTMGYAAVSLMVAYDVWSHAFQDNYNESYGAPNGIPDVMDEVKVATDFFMKSFIDDNTFVYYVGFDGDHNVWMTSANQSLQKVENGGDPRPFWTTSDKGGPQAANYSSALSLMAIHYPDDAYKAKCKEYAVKAYNYAKRHKENISIPTFYPSPNSEWTDELALAAILLYRVTGDETYKNEALGYLQNKWESNSPLAWDTVSDFAYYYIAKADPSADNGSGGTIVSFLEKNVFKLHIPAAESDQNGFPYYKSTWGTNKLACGGAVSAALYLKLVEDGVITSSENVQKAKNFVSRIVDYVMGKNEFNHTFLHGFKGDMTFRIHHRNAMGRNDNPPTNTKNTCDFMFASGGVIGGPSGPGRFENIIEGGSSYTETEGGCDYNAPFVAAIASMVSVKDPAELLELKEISRHSFMVYPTLFDDYLAVDLLERSYQGEVMARLYSVDGTLVAEQRLTDKVSTLWETSGYPKGLYFMQIINDGKVVTYKLMKN